MPRRPSCGESVSAYADEITIILTKMEHPQRVGEAIKVYETVTGANINQEESVDLQLGTLRGKWMLSDSIGGRWTKDSVVKSVVRYKLPDSEELGWEFE